MHEAVFENGFRDHGSAFSDAHQRHELRLHICGEAREGFGHHIRAAKPIAACDAKPAFFFRDIHAGFTQRARHRAQMIQARPLQQQRPASDGSGASKGAGFNPVRDDGVRCGAKACHAFHQQTICADAFNPCPHAHQAGGEVSDFGLARGVQNLALPACQSRCH